MKNICYCFVFLELFLFSRIVEQFITLISFVVIVKKITKNKKKKRKKEKNCLGDS